MGNNPQKIKLPCSKHTFKIIKTHLSYLYVKFRETCLLYTYMQEEECTKTITEFDFKSCRKITNTVQH